MRICENIFHMEFILPNIFLKKNLIWNNLVELGVKCLTPIIT